MKRNRRPYKKKIGHYIEVKTENDLFDYSSKIQMHCKNQEELDQRMEMYKGRVRYLGNWNGKRFEGLKKK